MLGIVTKKLILFKNKYFAEFWVFLEVRPKAPTQFTVWLQNGCSRSMM